jgi:hypothetical protein
VRLVICKNSALCSPASKNQVLLLESGISFILPLL